MMKFLARPILLAFSLVLAADICLAGVFDFSQDEVAQRGDGCIGGKKTSFGSYSYHKGDRSTLIECLQKIARRYAADSELVIKLVEWPISFKPIEEKRPVFDSDGKFRIETIAETETPADWIIGDTPIYRSTKEKSWFQYNQSRGPLRLEPTRTITVILPLRLADSLDRKEIPSSFEWL